LRRYSSTVYAVIMCPSVCLPQADTVPQEAQLPQRDHMMCYVSKFVLCFTRYGSLMLHAPAPAKYLVNNRRGPVKRLRQQHTPMNLLYRHLMFVLTDDQVII